MRIAIVGGGIGGMTLALALANVGLVDVDVFEAAPVIRELGVGINILPHAVRELDELGLMEALSATGIPTGELVYYTKRGQRIWAEPRGLAAGYRWPQLSIDRGRLLGILHAAVAERLPGRVHAGHQAVQVGWDDRRAWCDFLDPTAGTPRGRVDAELVVACDGVHSVVRQALYPDEGPPLWNGNTMWRGISVGAPLLTGRSMIAAGHSRLKVVVYPISRAHELRGEALLNWLAELRTGDSRPMPPQDWTHTACVEDVLGPFASFRFDFLDVPAMIRRAEVVYQYPMVDRDPLPTWAFERVTLLGDAAHPMYPMGSNGASQAIVDARVLARELMLAPSIASAITAYDQKRRPVTAVVAAANRQFGPALCQELVEERAPDGFAQLEDVVTRQELEEIAGCYKRAAGFDLEALNSRASL